MQAYIQVSMYMAPVDDKIAVTTTFKLPLFGDDRGNRGKPTSLKERE
jgi:hypothetical protein